VILFVFHFVKKKKTQKYHLKEMLTFFSQEPNGMIISMELLQLITVHNSSLQDKLLQILMFIFQTVCSDPLLQVTLVVRCISVQRRVYLLSQPLSSHAQQAVVMEEEPFTSPIAVVNVF
jgi:hypothetical protein